MSTTACCDRCGQQGHTTTRTIDLCLFRAIGRAEEAERRLAALEQARAGAAAGAALASAPGEVTAREVLRAAVEATALILCRRAVEAAPVSECDETCPHDCHAALMREAVAALAALKAPDEGGPP